MLSKIFNKKNLPVIFVIFVAIVITFFVGSKTSKNNFELADEIIPKTVLIRLIVDFNGNFVSYDIVSEETIVKGVDKLIPLTKYGINSVTYNVLSYIPKQGKVILYRGVDGTEILIDAYIFDIKTKNIKKLNDSALFYIMPGYSDSVASISPDGRKLALNTGEAIGIYDFLVDKELKLIKTDDVKNKNFFPFSETASITEEGGNFKWINENLLQYPIYVKVGDKFELKKTETIEIK